VNALADNKVAEFVNEHCVATYMKVGTFRIVNGQKQGGNVASYFCLPDGSVLHAVAGPVDARKFLNEGRWAVETRKAALTLSTNLVNGDHDQGKYVGLIRQAHEERYHAEQFGGKPIIVQKFKNMPQHNGANLPVGLPQNQSKQAQVHWLLSMNTLVSIERLYPIVWQQVLNEQLSGLPVVKN